jgi:hypothetical protein
MMISSYGWPISLLMAVGVLALWNARARDGLALVVSACGVVYVLFVVGSAVSPIEPRFQRYSEEFISRVNFAVMPAAVALAAKGAAWAWRRAADTRALAALVLVWSVIVGINAWLFWLQ